MTEVAWWKLHKEKDGGDETAGKEGEEVKMTDTEKSSH